MKSTNVAAEGRFTAEQEARLVRAIKAAEEDHRGEVRIHVEDETGGQGSVDRAREVFGELGMGDTERGTAVLLYVAEEDRKAAVWAGRGLYEARERGFWHEVVDAVSDGYRKGAPVDGLERAIQMISEVLAELAEGRDIHGNELPNRVSTGD